MKTKAGEMLLKLNTKEMDRLNKEMKSFYLELKEFDPKLSKEDRHNLYGDPSKFQRLLNNIKKNRQEYRDLQSEIDLLCHLESFSNNKKG